jgi:hypothetical protein
VTEYYKSSLYDEHVANIRLENHYYILLYKIIIASERSDYDNNNPSSNWRGAEKPPILFLSKYLHQKEIISSTLSRTTLRIVPHGQEISLASKNNFSQNFPLFLVKPLIKHCVNYCNSYGKANKMTRSSF